MKGTNNPEKKSGLDSTCCKLAYATTTGQTPTATTSVVPLRWHAIARSAVSAVLQDPVHGDQPTGLWCGPQNPRIHRAVFKRKFDVTLMP